MLHYYGVTHYSERCARDIETIWICSQSDIREAADTFERYLRTPVLAIRRIDPERLR